VGCLSLELCLYLYFCQHCQCGIARHETEKPSMLVLSRMEKDWDSEFTALLD